jgi:hypothetical protein
MKDKKTPFFAFRYLVVPENNQVSMIHTWNGKTKEELMTGLIEGLIDNKTEFIYHSKRYLLYGAQQKGNIYIFKFAKERNESIYTEGDIDIEKAEMKTTKFIYLFINVEHQIILIERNTTVFSKIESAVQALSDFFRQEMIKFDYLVNVYPLVSKMSFWNYIDEADFLYSLNLVMNAPNMAFLGNNDTREVLEEIKKSTNNEEFELTFTNKEGKLKIAKDTLGNWINYIMEVGGRYSIRFKKNNVEETKTSSDDTVKTYIAKRKSDEFDDQDLLDISDKFKSIHLLETRIDEEDEN